MDDADFIIRIERQDEYRDVENLVRDAFWNVYRPGCLEHYLLHQLRCSNIFIPELDFAMEQDGELIGQCASAHAVVRNDDGQSTAVITIGPICIAEEYRGRGYGKTLLDHALKTATELGFGAVLLEGNIEFYGKCGFTFAREFGIRYQELPANADSSFFLCKELIPGYLNGVSGEYSSPLGCLVNETEAEEFDRTFPFKEKLKLPGQIF